MGEELGTVYQCHLYGDGEPRKQRCWRWGRPCWGPEAQTPLGSSPSLSAQSLLCCMAAVGTVPFPRVLDYVLGPRQSYNRTPPPCFLVPTRLVEERMRARWAQKT